MTPPSRSDKGEKLEATEEEGNDERETPTSEEEDANEAPESRFAYPDGSDAAYALMACEATPPFDNKSKKLCVEKNSKETSEGFSPIKHVLLLPHEARRNETPKKEQRPSAARQVSVSGYEYHDYSHVEPSGFEPYEPYNNTRIQKLPYKLHAMLSNPDYKHIISWRPHGRSWKIHHPQDFVEQVLPLYFEYTNHNSFIRLVNAWGFRRITKGIDRNSYFHEVSSWAHQSHSLSQIVVNLMMKSSPSSLLAAFPSRNASPSRQDASIDAIREEVASRARRRTGSLHNQRATSAAPGAHETSNNKEKETATRGSERGSETKASHSSLSRG